MPRNGRRVATTGHGSLSDSFSGEELVEDGRAFFGSTSQGLASLVERAVSLSDEKYCSASAMLACSIVAPRISSPTTAGPASPVISPRAACNKSL